MKKDKTIFQQEQYKLKISFATVLVLMMWGLSFNSFTESNIIALDASAYVISGIVGLLTIYVSKLQERPKDSAHPLGYAGFVPLLNLLRSFMIILICLKGITESLGDILYNGPSETNHKILFIYSFTTLVFNSFAFFYISYAARKLESDLLKTDSMEWRIDMFYNISIILAFTLSYLISLTDYRSFADYIDPSFCILLSLYMMYSPVMLFYANARLLSVSAVDEEIKKDIQYAVMNEHPGLKKDNPEFTVLHIAGCLWLDIELKLKQDEMLTVHEMDQIKQGVGIIMNEKKYDYQLSFQFTDQ